MAPVMSVLKRGLAGAAALAALSACGGPLIESTERGVFVLIDASGTYARQMPESVTGSRLLTMKLDSGDMIAVAQIGSCSFSDGSVVLRATLPSTPSRASLRKQEVFGQLDSYGSSFQSTAFTDIRGALKYAAFELSQSGKDQRYIIVFSDMVEDTAPDCDTRELALDLTGITVIATNVTKLKSDAANPEAFMERLQEWQAVVTAAGGEWVYAPTTEQVLDAIG